MKKTIEQLAREAGAAQDEGLTYFEKADLQRFHALAIAQYREGLLAGVGEPDFMTTGELDEEGHKQYIPSYTADQMAAAVLRERIKPLESVVELSTVGATYPELMKYLQAEIEAIRGQR